MHTSNTVKALNTCCSIQINFLDQKWSGGDEFKLKSIAFPSANYWENKAQCSAVILRHNDQIYLVI